MKKLISILLSAIAVISCTNFAFAQEISTSNTQEDQKAYYTDMKSEITYYGNESDILKIVHAKGSEETALIDQMLKNNLITIQSSNKTISDFVIGNTDNNIGVQKERITGKWAFNPTSIAAGSSMIFAPGNTFPYIDIAHDETLHMYLPFDSSRSWAVGQALTAKGDSISETVSNETKINHYFAPKASGQYTYRLKNYMNAKLLINAGYMEVLD